MEPEEGGVLFPFIGPASRFTSPAAAGSLWRQYPAVSPGTLWGTVSRRGRPIVQTARRYRHHIAIPAMKPFYAGYRHVVVNIVPQQSDHASVRRIRTRKIGAEKAVLLHRKIRSLRFHGCPSSASISSIVFIISKPSCFLCPIVLNRKQPGERLSQLLQLVKKVQQGLFLTSRRMPFQ